MQATELLNYLVCQQLLSEQGFTIIFMEGPLPLVIYEYYVITGHR